MGYLKKISWFVWGILTALISYSILRMIAGASSMDFVGKGTSIYLFILMVYSVATFFLGLKNAKKWYYYYLLLVLICLASPLVLILYLNYFGK
ncbi:hypothetical protein ATZ33_10820 [Enterococcus silesiacus]|uniref:Uncharacterized protein n=1 Tax=Enterococcus silesiacus TaxID=332949 RepID=A0ABN4J7L3_9ENTE|nr:hypothetical protein ATZ33_10820 [Enterococcus silesiacus]